MWKYLKSLLVPNDCLLCEFELLNSEKTICRSCLDKIPRTGINNLKDNELYFRLAGKTKLEGAYSMFYFEKQGLLQELIGKLKYKGLPQIGRFLGQQLGYALQPFLEEEKEIHVVPVPLHPRKKLMRGYNQAEEIAKGLCEVLDLKLGNKLLKRSQNTSTQTRKAASARWNNVSDAFVSVKERPEKILLIDDIATTGSTMEACTRALHENTSNPIKIWVASVGLAQKA